MLRWEFWALVALLNTQLNTLPSPAHLAFGLAVVVTALVVVAAIRLPVLTSAGAPGLRAFARRARTATRPRLLDPDAAGRPRSRAPNRCPATA
jgi:hypothetical protein